MITFSSSKLMPQFAEDVFALFDGAFSGHSWSLAALKQAVDNRHHYFFSAYEGAQLVGVVHFSTILDEAEILNIAVSHDFLHLGIGTQLLEQTITFLRANNFHTLYLEVRKNNAFARNLYIKTGFIKDGYRKNYYQNPSESAVLYHYDIKEVDNEKS